MDNKTLNSLDAHYEFWDKYVSDWLNKEIDTPYLPEPWWGWTPYSKEPLHSVVIPTPSLPSAGQLSVIAAA